MELFIKENGRMEIEKDAGYNGGLMDHDMKAFGKETKQMDKVC
jgi:hypothetical protein